MVADISNPLNNINQSDSYLIDTNVLSAMLFSIHQWPSDKISAYTSFVLNLLQNNVTLYVSTLSLQELYHLAERIAYEHYCNSNSLSKRAYGIKKFRKNSTARTNLASTLSNIHSIITNQYTIIEDTISKNTVQKFVDTYDQHIYDPMDFVVVENNLDKCKKVITDDKDFQNDSRLTIFTYITH